MFKWFRERKRKRLEAERDRTFNANEAERIAGYWAYHLHRINPRSVLYNCYNLDDDKSWYWKMGYSRAEILHNAKLKSCRLGNDV